MRLSSTIVEPGAPISLSLPAHLLLSAASGIGLVFVVLAVVSFGNPGPGLSVDAWRRHHEECRRLPDELYHRDRFRAIEGRVTDDEGRPVREALVRCVKLESLLEVARSGAHSPAKLAVPIEAETTASDDGKYKFPHLPVGARTFFYSAPGRSLAPAIKDLVVVQDGLSAQLDVSLGRSRTLRVRLKAAAKDAMRLHLIPHRWWPELPTAVARQGQCSVEFAGLGGPLSKGLIASSAAESSRMDIVGRYDLDLGDEAVLDAKSPPASRLDVPEAAGLVPWHDPPTSSERLFFVAMSPVALFWPAPDDDGTGGRKTSNLAPTPPPCQSCGNGDSPGIRPSSFPAGPDRVAGWRGVREHGQRRLGI